MLELFWDLGLQQKLFHEYKNCPCISFDENGHDQGPFAQSTEIKNFRREGCKSNCPPLQAARLKKLLTIRN